MGFWDKFRREKGVAAPTSRPLESMLAEAEGLNSLQVKSLVEPIVQAALAREDGPQTVISWWRDGAPAGNANYSRAVVAANIHHHLVDELTTMYAELEFDALATLEAEVVSWAFCGCGECRQKMLPARAQVAQSRLLELSGPAREKAIAVLRQAEVEPDVTQLQHFLANAPSREATEWLRDFPETARQVASYLLDQRVEMGTASALLRQAGLDAPACEKLRQAFLDPDVTEHLLELATLLRSVTGWDAAGFAKLDRHAYDEALHAFGGPARWPRWAPGAELPEIDAIDGAAAPKFRELVVGLAREIDPRRAMLLRAATQHYDPDGLARFAEAFFVRWVEDGRKKAGEHALALVTLFGSPSFFRRTMAELGNIGRAQMVRLLDAHAVARRGLDWIAYWQTARDEPSVQKRAAEILRREAEAHAMDEGAFRATLDPYVADTALESEGATEREYRDLLKRAFDAERTWSGANFRRWYVERADAMTAAGGLVFSVDGRRCSFVEGELLALDDEPIEVPDDAAVTLAHPAEMPADEVISWTTWLAEYEIVQPFPQLEATVYDAEAIDRMLEDVDSKMGRFVKILARSGFRWSEAGNIMVIDDTRTQRFFTLEYYADGYDPDEPIELEAWGFDGVGELRARFVSRVARALSRACR